MDIQQGEPTVVFNGGIPQGGRGKGQQSEEQPGRRSLGHHSPLRIQIE